MEEKRKSNFNSGAPFSRKLLEQLKEQGYKYFQIKGYANDNKFDYIQPKYLILIPYKKLPEKPNDIEIYESIDSDIFSSWADTEFGAKVIVSAAL